MRVFLACAARRGEGLGFCRGAGFGFGFGFGFGVVWCAGLCAGIRDLLACFTRRPCAGRHLLFFAAAKKSRQKKAAHTASANYCLRAPKRFLRFIRQSRHSCSLPALLRCASPASRTCASARRARQATAAQVANCVSALCAPHASLQTDCARAPPGKSAKPYDATTYTQFATWAALTIRCRLTGYGYLKWVRRLFEALATSTNQDTAA